MFNQNNVLRNFTRGNQVIECAFQDDINGNQEKQALQGGGKLSVKEERWKLKVESMKENKRIQDFHKQLRFEYFKKFH